MALLMAPPMMSPRLTATSLSVTPAGQPDGHGERRHDGKAGQAAIAPAAFLQEQAVADAEVLDVHEVEERRDRDPALVLDAVDEQHPPLVRLVDSQGQGGEPDPERRQRPP